MNETLSKPSPEQITDPSLHLGGEAEPILAEQEQEYITVVSKPISELPPVGDTSVEGEEFWVRRQLRPESEGGNFHNLPVLQFGIEYKDDQAVLSLPSRDYLNTFVELYNPGGFTFVATGTKGLEKKSSFLGHIGHKQFPMSEDRTVLLTAIEDHYEKVKNGDTSLKPNTAENHYHKISAYEHDWVDHVAIAAIPGSEVEKIAAVSENLKELKVRSISIVNGEQVETLDIDLNATAHLDRLLDLLAYYAILPTEPKPGLQTQLKEYVWESVKAAEIWLNACVMGGREGEDPAPLAQLAIENGEGLVLEKAVIDQNIARLQKLDKTASEQITARLREKLKTGN